MSTSQKLFEAHFRKDRSFSACMVGELCKEQIEVFYRYAYKRHGQLIIFRVYRGFISFTLAYATWSCNGREAASLQSCHMLFIACRPHKPAWVIANSLLLDPESYGNAAYHRVFI